MEIKKLDNDQVAAQEVQELAVSPLLIEICQSDDFAILRRTLELYSRNLAANAS